MHSCTLLSTLSYPPSGDEVRRRQTYAIGLRSFLLACERRGVILAGGQIHAGDRGIYLTKCEQPNGFRDGANFSRKEGVDTMPLLDYHSLQQDADDLWYWRDALPAGAS